MGSLRSIGSSLSDHGFTRLDTSRRVVGGLALCLMTSACFGASGSGSASPREPVVEEISTKVRFTPAPIPRISSPADNWLEAGCNVPLDHLRRIRRGYMPRVSPDVTVVAREPNFFGGFIGQSHSGPWDYVQEVPLVFYGPGIIEATGTVETDRETTLADVAPTTARLLGTNLPRAMGRPIQEVVEVTGPTARPKLVLTVVWDGGGNNVLRAWPNEYPNLRRMMRDGVSIKRALVGSSPSITPAAHTNIGTGVFPKQHGVTGIPLRVGSDLTSAFGSRSPDAMRSPSLADIYDKETGNLAKAAMVGFKSWHLGMLGHGAYLPGGDKDIAVIINTKEELVTNPHFYSLPPYLHNVGDLERTTRVVDADDGKVDGKWMGHDMLDDPRGRRDTPVWIHHQTELIKALISREGFGRDEVPDLFYTNYKQIDETGHNFNMLFSEMAATLRNSDEALGHLERFLNRTVGPGEWAIAVTADHGQGPLAEAAHAWPISIEELRSDVQAHLGGDLDDVFQKTHLSGFWLQPDLPNRRRIERELSDFLIDYRLEDNADGREVPAQYEERLREPILAAAFPSKAMGKLWRCALDRARRNDE